ncbi:MAG: EF-P lysine aminoacylase EpmA [Bacteriovoracia bacterium]
MKVKKELLEKRAQIIQFIRQFFYENSFIETDTPTFVKSPGMEPHIRPYRVEQTQAFLPTSPEFAMKKVLSYGFDRIFQICKAYRNEPLSTTHHPEFTILEWYRTNSGYEEIMDDVENLFSFLSTKLTGSSKFRSPWPRFTIEECFSKFTKTNLVDLIQQNRSDFDDEFFRIFLNEIEPELAKLNHPVIVHLYPESQAALSNLVTDARGLKWAKRFEVYAGGFELANAFDELTNSQEQRKRFIKDMGLRENLYGAGFPPNPIDEEFLSSLDHLPPCGGIALGVDRLIMYLLGIESIEDVLWQNSFLK